jgi:DNA-binding transcriptional LysR family regulator
MPLSLEQLLTLQAAADSGSFSAAARRLGKAQSVVSTAIANLETDLDITLFERGGRYPHLTPAGEQILRQARQILGQCEALTAYAGELAAGVEPKLTLAIDDDSQLPWLGGIHEACALQFPQVELELLFPLMEDLVEMLLSGRAQLGIGYEPQQPREELCCHSLGRVGLPLVVAPHHPLAGMHQVTRETLQGQRQILATGHGTGPERSRFRISTQVWWVEGDQAMLEIVKKGLGWASVPEVLLAAPLKNREVVRLHAAKALGQPSLQLGLWWHRAHPLGRAGLWLREALTHADIRKAQP